MTNKELMELSHALGACRNLKGIKFSYAVAKNIDLISRELKPVTELIVKLQQKHAKKDEKGKMVINGKIIEMEDKEKFEKEFEELMGIENENLGKLHKIKKEDLPDDISVAQLSGIIDLIEE